MGLTSDSVGIKAVDMGFSVKKDNSDAIMAALAGNPNVGKSSVFNCLTGLNQHTGNWPGKTVANASGSCFRHDREFILVDIPGTYSLMAHSAEEEVARDFICYGGAEAVIVVCDATALERSLNLVLQTIEITKRVVVCVNLLDEAEKKGIKINLELLSRRLGVPVVGTSAKCGKGMDRLLESVESTAMGEAPEGCRVRYLAPIEAAAEKLENVLLGKIKALNPRWAALRLLENDSGTVSGIYSYTGLDPDSPELADALKEANKSLLDAGITPERLKDNIASCLILNAEDIINGAVEFDNPDYGRRDRKIDRLLTGRLTGVPLMLLLLGLVLWLTITGANYPSALLSDLLFFIEDKLVALCGYAGIPEAVYAPVIFGVYRVLAWVVSVMLPPMAIFFPLFTLLEDLGYLPRVAFNLDKAFKKCCSCGKQALTMCMGFGCNAAGIIGCRIIDSPRERLIAVITNSFVPCNGRFPLLISVTSMFLISGTGVAGSAAGALILTFFILLGILMTFAVSRLLSVSLLKGKPSSFTLELPPYRRPDIGRIIVRSVLDRTLYVLGRAVTVAAPAGLIIWLLANLTADGIPLLKHLSAFLDPAGRLMGLDGVILLAFILGFPANELVIPLIIMMYMSNGTLAELDSLTAMKELFVQNGWTWITAVSVMLFSLFHWPCSTTMLTIKKETGSMGWTLLSFAIPTAAGIIICILFSSVAGALSLAG
ncbi:MAG: ferrous iron transport protein B [Clostridia bacterium]|nr:ferrous iron transport protein B [Clostridia bacterium]